MNRSNAMQRAHPLFVTEPPRKVKHRGVVLFAAASFLAPLAFGVSNASASGGSQVFIPGAVVNADHTVTLPIYQGRTNDGRNVWFAVTEASTSNQASIWRANHAQKLENAKGTVAVQKVRLEGNTIVFPATVDFSPVRSVTPDPNIGFPPLGASPGAIGEAGYSPLIQLPDGSVLNAPHLANASGLADKIKVLDANARTVRYVLSDGFARGNAVTYISTEASDRGAAALEGVTFAPNLNAAPQQGNDGTDSARAGLVAFVNGATGVGSPNRQGLNSALLGQGDPLNVLGWLPTQGRYSPLWDVHLSMWAPGQTPTLQTEFARIAELGATGKVTSPGGAPWAATGFIVNCPIIAQL